MVAPTKVFSTYRFAVIILFDKINDFRISQIYVHKISESQGAT
jgi:hypothetical protein